jgi:elongation factor P
MPKASEIKRNMAVDYDGKTYIVRGIDRSVPQGRAGGSIYRMRMYDVVSGRKLDESFKDSDMILFVDLLCFPIQMVMNTFSWTAKTTRLIP